MNKDGTRRKFFKSVKVSLGFYFSVLAVLASFVAGIVLGERAQKTTAETAKAGTLTNKNIPQPSYVSKDVDMAQFWKVWDGIKSSSLYASEASDPKLFYGSIKGMVASLGDPYSVYFDPEEAAQFASQLEGTFDGIGAEIGYKNTQLIVVAPLPGTPAFKAGLKPGDAIMKINGEEAANMAVDLAIMKIRGPKGTKVTLNIFREGKNDPFDVEITRDKIVIDSVKSKMVGDDGKEISGNGGIGLIMVSEFNQDTVKEFDAALNAMLMRGAKGIIIDLRDDPGGYLDAAVELPRAWIGKQTAVIQRMADGKEQKLSPTGKAGALSLPTVVLVNKWSASASEIVTGAMQDYGKATVVGETTFGKGSVQEYLDDFADGSALKLTMAEWLTPKGRFINKKGITPDITVAITEEDVKAGKDPQLEKAIEVINTKPDAASAEKKP